MLRVHVAEGLTELAGELAGVLADPLDDPMAPEIVTVPTAGVQRWLSLELARHLGATGPSVPDGVSANIEMLFPGELTRRILDDGSGQDPWALERVAWVILGELHGTNTDGNHTDGNHTDGNHIDGNAQASATIEDAPDLAALRRRLELAPGATEWARARRIADLFDTYMTHRPDMVLTWLEGRDVDGTGGPIDRSASWQPELWRRIRRAIGSPSPPEVALERIATLGSGARPRSLPPRLALFGLTTVPGGAPQLELLDALSRRCDVHLMLVQPSMSVARRVRDVAPVPHGHPEPSQPTDHLVRTEDRSADLVANPLLRSWGRSSRETMVLVGNRFTPEPTSVPPASASTGGGSTDDSSTGDGSTDDGSTTLLHELQHQISSDSPPSATWVPEPGDTSVVIHACHGETRQVEVLRDQILHLLADDPTLLEDDIAIICPALERFAPLIESVFGLPERAPVGPGSAEPSASTDEARPRTPGLRYRLADRSLGRSYELLTALGSLVELLASRFSERAILDLASLPVVRRAFRFDDDDLGQLGGWMESTNARWGLDAQHRTAWGLPADYSAGTWQRALDRLTMGVFASEDDTTLAVGGLLPVAVEGSGVSLLGRTSRLVSVLSDLESRVREPHSIERWVALLSRACSELFEPDRDRLWETQRLESLFDELLEDADGSPTRLSLDDMRHLIGGRLQESSGRPGFFRGGITVSSPTPLRGVPYRVICLLGMDQSAYAPATTDGDDLMAADPFVGDRDRRSDVRQSLLDTVLAAGDQLVILRNGADVITNQNVKPAVVLAELVDTVTSMVHPDHRDRFVDALTMVHPRQRFDEANFIAGDDARSTDPASVGWRSRAWSFDPIARDGAMARRECVAAPRFSSGPLSETDPRVLAAGGSAREVSLSSLARFFKHPQRTFLQRVLEIQLPESPERDDTERLLAPVGSSGIPPAAPGRDTPVKLTYLDRWKVWDALLDHRLSGGDPAGFIAAERARDRLPPGALGEQYLTDGLALTDEMLSALDDTGADLDAPLMVPVEVELGDGTSVTGEVLDHGGRQRGPVTISMSQFSDKHLIQPWLSVLAATAMDPETTWQATLVNRKDSGCKTTPLTMLAEDPDERRAAAIEALEQVVELYRTGMREPLPLFSAMSKKLYQRKAGPRDWDGGFIPGDGDDTWVRTAFDHASFDQITSLELRTYDPPGNGGDRARRYASLLWSSFERTATTEDRKAS
ncbi:MAG: exodeoxyribonuclease V subunit gamma [Microthrixaceae bacterium]